MNKSKTSIWLKTKENLRALAKFGPKAYDGRYQEAVKAERIAKYNLTHD